MTAPKIAPWTARPALDPAPRFGRYCNALAEEIALAERVPIDRLEARADAARLVLERRRRRSR